MWVTTRPVELIDEELKELAHLSFAIQEEVLRIACVVVDHSHELSARYSGDEELEQGGRGLCVSHQ